jgi:hypothetical protein
MTTKYEAGRFWVVDSVTLEKIPTFPSFATWTEARDVIGDRWVDAVEA